MHWLNWCVPPLSSSRQRHFRIEWRGMERTTYPVWQPIAPRCSRRQRPSVPRRPDHRRAPHSWAWTARHMIIWASELQREARGAQELEMEWEMEMERWKWSCNDEMSVQLQGSKWGGRMWDVLDESWALAKVKFCVSEMFLNGFLCFLVFLLFCIWKILLFIESLEFGFDYFE